MIQQSVNEMNPSCTISLIKCVKKAFENIGESELDCTVLSFDKKMEVRKTNGGEKVKKW